MDKETILNSILVLFILVSFGLALKNTIKLNNSEWTCVAQECSEYITGNDWVKQNCNIEGNEMICKFQYEGQDFRIPLSEVNVSNMISCKNYECSSSVLVSTDKSKGGI